MLPFLLIVGLISKEDFYNLQDGDGRLRVKTWTLIRWLAGGKKTPAHVLKD